MKRALQIVLTVFVLVSAAQPASAQIITPTKHASDAKERQRQLEVARADVDRLRAAGDAVATKEALERAEKRVTLLATGGDEEAPRNGFLPQASFLAGSSSGQISIDAATLYFKEAKWRFYLRSTLSTETAATNGEEDAQAAEAALTKSLDDRIKSALNDPYGGLLYLAAGRMFSITRDQSDPSRGWFLDTRLGAKFVQLPKSPVNGRYGVTPFWVGSIGIRLSEPLWYDTNGDSSAGRLDATISVVRNHVLDKSISALFEPDATGAVALATKTNSLNVGIGLSITDSVGLIISGTAWSSSKLDRTFALGLTLLNK